MLACVGLPEVDNIEGSSENYVDAWIAYTILRETTSDVLALGINDNTNMVTLYPDENGKVHVPKDALWVRAITPERGNGCLIVRDGMLFDRDRMTNDINTPVRCEVKWALNYADLQPYVRIYIRWRAARDFQQRIKNDPQLDAYLVQKEGEALVDFRAQEAQAIQAQMLDSEFMAEPMAGYGASMSGRLGSI